MLVNTREALLIYCKKGPEVKFSCQSFNVENTYFFQLKVTTDTTRQELTCTDLMEDEDNAPFEYFRTCNKTDPKFWNITTLQKEITGMQES